MTHRFLALLPMAIALGQEMSWFASVFTISCGRVGSGTFGHVGVRLADLVFT